MMTYSEANSASLEQLTDELAAAGWDSTQTTRDEALAAVTSLVEEYSGKTQLVPRRNKDGKQNLSDLRKLLAQRDDLNVSRIGGNWEIGRFADGGWYITRCHYYTDERQAIQLALFGSEEAEYERQYEAYKSR